MRDCSCRNGCFRCNPTPLLWIAGFVIIVCGLVAFLVIAEKVAREKKENAPTFAVE